MRRAPAGRRLPTVPTRKAAPVRERPVKSARHPDCTCGLDADGRWHDDCTHHRELNARLDAQRDHRPFAVRQAEAVANVTAFMARKHRREEPE